MRFFDYKIVFAIGSLIGWWVLYPVLLNKSVGKGDWQDVTASILCAIGVWTMLYCLERRGKI